MTTIERPDEEVSEAACDRWWRWVSVFEQEGAQAVLGYNYNPADFDDEYREAIQLAAYHTFIRVIELALGDPATLAQIAQDYHIGQWFDEGDEAAEVVADCAHVAARLHAAFAQQSVDRSPRESKNKPAQPMTQEEVQIVQGVMGEIRVAQRTLDKRLDQLLQLVDGSARRYRTS